MDILNINMTIFVGDLSLLKILYCCQRYVMQDKIIQVAGLDLYHK